MTNFLNEVIGVDHGNSSIKTANFVTTTGIAQVSTEPALKENVLEIDNKYYSLTNARFGLKLDKTEDQKFYLLTLVAIAQELRYRGIHTANIYLAVGLPPARFGAEKEKFKKYMLQKRDIAFKFEGQLYRIHIDKVGIYPQCYSAVVDNIADYKRKTYVVDLGSLTLDLVQIVNYTYAEANCLTLNQGIINCVQAINKETVRQFNYEVDEADINEIMITGESTLPNKVVVVIKKVIVEYVDKLFKLLLENGVNAEYDRITFVGGGATIIKNYSSISSPNIVFKTDIHANAKGYEFLMRKSIKR